MTERSRNDVDADAIDTGEPIALLRGLEEPASTSFSERLRHRIYRRRLGADIGRLTWEGPIIVVVEFLSMLFGVLGVGVSETKKEG